MIPVLDTNILIDFSFGIPEARREIERYRQASISALTWIEFMSGEKTEERRRLAAEFLSRFEVIYLDQEIARTAAEVRRERRVKLPDAIIWATAEARRTLLVTRNSKDFPADHPIIRIPYRLD